VAQLTAKELMLIEDNIKLQQNMSQFASFCTQQISNQQLRSLCQQMEQEHQNEAQQLASLILNSQTH